MKCLNCQSELKPTRRAQFCDKHCREYYARTLREKAKDPDVLFAKAMAGRRFNDPYPNDRADNG